MTRVLGGVDDAALAAPCAAPHGHAAPFAIEFLPPPPAIAPYVTTFFSLRYDRVLISDVQPATIAVLLVSLKGRIRLLTPSDAVYDSPGTGLITPLSAAAAIEVEGPWHAFGATITPLGWAALTRGLSAARWADRVVDASSLLGDEVGQLGERLTRDHRAGMINVADMVAMTAQVFADRAMPVPVRHRAAIAAVADWLGSSLSPQLEDLVARTPYSVRQMQRLVDHYYGLGPKHLARKYRALRAAALLLDPGISAEQVVHVEEQFYDQSHMIREIRLFAGCTPGQLARADKPVLAAALDWRNNFEITPKVAPMPPGYGIAT